MSPVLTIGQVAKQSGLRPSAIRFYEKSGLLPNAVRSGGQRRYSPAILGRLAVLQRAKDCGLTLDEARELFNGQGRPSERWQRIARRKIIELDAFIQRIAGMCDLLQRRCDCADLEECGRKMVAQKSARSPLC